MCNENYDVHVEYVAMNGLGWNRLTKKQTNVFKWIYIYDYVSITCFSVKNVTKISVDR